MRQLSPDAKQLLHDLWDWAGTLEFEAQEIAKGVYGVRPVLFPRSVKLAYALPADTSPARLSAAIEAMGRWMNTDGEFKLPGAAPGLYEALGRDAKALVAWLDGLDFPTDSPAFAKVMEGTTYVPWAHPGWELADTLSHIRVQGWKTRDGGRRSEGRTDPEGDT